MDPLTIRQGATVYDANGDKLGKVHQVDQQSIVVEKGFFFPTDYTVPLNLVTSATDDEVHLSVTKDQAIDRSRSVDPGWAPASASVAQPMGTPLGAAPIADARYAGSRTNVADETTRTDEAAASAGEVVRVPVHEEELTATKRPVDQGQVRITKDVVAEDKTLEVPVTEERVRVTRRAVDRDATGDETAFDEATIDVPVQGEAVDVQKRVRVAEEVEVAKEAVQRTERVGDTVRREEVHVEDQTTGADPATRS
jgi:uncharacterized protein (TIGR02271 family)